MSITPREFCAACRVDEGECPDCGTFWWRRGSEKIGMRRVGPGGGRCRWTDSAEQLPQCVRLTPEWQRDRLAEALRDLGEDDFVQDVLEGRDDV